MARRVAVGFALGAAVAGAVAPPAVVDAGAGFTDYDGLRGGTELPRLDLRGEALEPASSEEAAASSSAKVDYTEFEFEDLLSYSYHLGEASAPDKAQRKGGFGQTFTLDDMNFGRIKEDGKYVMGNSGRGDGFYVRGSQFRGFKAGSLTGMTVAPAGDFNGDGVDDVIVGARGAREAYVLFGKNSYAEFRRQLHEAGKYDSAIDSLPYDSVVMIRNTDNDMDDGFAEQVASAGDIDGDGYDDVLVSAPSAQGDTGRVYVIYGGKDKDICCDPIDVSESFPVKRGFYIEGKKKGDFFGSSIAGAFDFNNDGMDDFVVGADGYKNHEGVALLVYGYGDRSRRENHGKFNHFADKGGDAATRGLLLTIKNTDEKWHPEVGCEVAGLDDVNGDGYDDVALGALGFGRNGAVFVVLGGANMQGSIYLDELDGSDGFGVLGANKGDFLGIDVKKAGDFNGDGYGDIVIGAAGHRHQRGMTYVVYGRPRFLATVPADVWFEGAVDDDMSGFAVSSAGDIDGDGFDDVVIGAFLAKPRGRSAAGEAYCVFGGAKKSGKHLLAKLTGFDGFTMYGGAPGDVAGYDVGAAGDFNDDGVDDLIVGSFLSDAGVKNGGSTFVVFGTEFDKVPTTMPTGPSAMPTPLPTSGEDHEDLSDVDGVLPFPPSIPLDTIGLGDSGISLKAKKMITSVGLSADIDGDGIDDILIAADDVVYVVYGIDDDDKIKRKLDGPLNKLPTKGSKGGAYATEIVAPFPIEQVSSAGDFNDDGYGDILIGCPSAEGGRGVVYVLLGTDSFAATTSLMHLVRGVEYIELWGKNNNYKLGSSLGYLDFNGDGYSDIVAGAPDVNEALVYYGGPRVELKATVVKVPAHVGPNDGFILKHSKWAPKAKLGTAVAGIGDVNGDGYEDLIVGAPGVDTACVVLGNNAENSATYDCDELRPDRSKPGFVVQLKHSDGSFGASVAKAGDVNGDTFGDFIVGAPDWRGGAGGAFVFFGRDDFDEKSSTEHAYIIKSTLAGGALGVSVAGGGDVNNDGLDDLLVGADDSRGKENTLSAGNAYVVYGSPLMKKNSIDVRDMDGVTQGFRLTGTRPGARAGILVASGGYDVNSDAVDDLMVVESGTTSEAYILFGMGAKKSKNIKPIAVQPPTDGSSGGGQTTLMPSPKPTMFMPTMFMPTPIPTMFHPTAMPTMFHPTPVPTTPQPSAMPTDFHPTPVPTAHLPTPLPTAFPPTPMPTTPAPTPVPTAFPPTPVPTAFPPTPMPTVPPPTPVPTAFPPTPKPTIPAPTAVPTAFAPTAKPTVPAPTAVPTAFAPTAKPTEFQPTPIPTEFQPTPIPTEFQPTPIPTEFQPTPLPTSVDPAPIPTAFAPTPIPTEFQPTPIPTEFQPTPIPTEYQPTPNPTATEAQPSVSPTPSTTTTGTLAPTTLQFRYENAAVAYVEATLRIGNLSKADFGVSEVLAVQFAVFDVLGDQGGEGVITSTDAVTNVYAVNVASIDMSFAAEVLAPYANYAQTPELLLARVNDALENSVTTGEMRERLIYWAGFFGANGGIADVDKDATVDNLNEATVDDNIYFSQPTFPPSVSPAPTVTPAPTPTEAPTSPTVNSSKKKKSRDVDADRAAIAVPVVLLILIIGCCLACYFLGLGCFAASGDDNDADKDAADSKPEDIPVEQVGATDVQDVPVDEADMTQATGDDGSLALVETNETPVADLQEKIIEADL